ncbi:MAG: cation-translocating P-type ATPase [Candidatus Magasanikbacteria bacterium]
MPQPNAVFSLLSISNYKTYTGLTSVQAQEAQQKYGLNIRPVGKRVTWLKRAWEIASEPMILLLLASAAIYFFIGDKVEAIILLGSIIPVVGLEFIQQQRTDEAIKALDKMMVESCQVYRDGEVKKMETKFIVPGDLIYITAGDKVPADGVLSISFGLLVDEAMLTGESIAAQKSAVDYLDSRLRGNDNNIVDENKLFQGTMVVQGEGSFVVTATGGNTSYGQLGNLLEKIEKISTPLQKKIHSLVRTIAIVAVAVAFLIGILLSLKYGWAEGVLGGLTMAMSLIPEEFPIVFSVFLIMGVWRMTKQNALTREMAMVETLGSATIICTDKTGTLTEGKMALEQIYHDDHVHTLKDLKKYKTDFTELIKIALLSLEQVAIDPMEVEVQKFASTLGIDVQQFYREHTLIEDLPFESKNKMVHHLWKNQNGICAQYSAGAPEFIIKHSKLSEKEKKSATKAYEEMAGLGYRVIAVAQRSCAVGEKILVENLQFAGILGMSDPAREGVKEAIDTCQKAGIRVIMITGDNKLTAHNIAEHIGLKHNEEIIVGTDLEGISKDALKAIVKRHDIFTRVKPEQKFDIVSALQEMGEVVAMTGDGVNDAPALKKANIGIAMGLKGTEVARAAAGIVLMDDNFSTIVKAIKEGRRIYDNLRQSFVFLFSFHLPIVGLAVLPLLFGRPLIFLPIHIIFLEMICDPSAVLGFEREKARHNLMIEPPRPTNEPLVNLKLIYKIIFQGLIILAVSFGLYYFYAVLHDQLELGRTMAFASLVVSQTFLILMTREWQQIKSNGLLFIISIATLIVLGLIIYLPALRNIFHLHALNSNELLLLIGLPLGAMIATVGVLKLFKK